MPATIPDSERPTPKGHGDVRAALQERGSDEASTLFAMNVLRRIDARRLDRFQLSAADLDQIAALLGTGLTPVERATTMLRDIGAIGFTYRRQDGAENPSWTDARS